MSGFVRVLFTATVYVFLYMPLAVMTLFSFNASKFTMTWKGFTLGWYAKLFANSSLIDAAWHSLTIAALSASAATVLGTVGAVAFTRYRFPGRKGLTASLFVCIMSPDIVMGISLLLLFVAVSASLGFWTLLLGHVTLCFPFVTVTVLARLKGFDEHLVEAARDLGGGEWDIFRRVLLPLSLPAVIGGWLLSFTLSLDDVMISFFTTGPTYEVLPLRIYSMVRLGVKPEVNALCAIMMAITLVAVAVAQRFVKVTK